MSDDACCPNCKVAGDRAIANPVTNESVEFEEITLAPGEIRKITVVPKLIFRGEKVVMVESQAMATFTHLWVGGRRQFPENARRTASAFHAPTTLGCGIRFDTCDITKGEDITIEVENRADIPVTWEAKIFGRGKSA